MKPRIETAGSPFPGIRPFEADEAHLFFGRDGQSDELLRLMRRSRFVAIVGTSGSGKSSLVRAGLLPSLEGGFLTTAGPDWRIAILRPADDPVGNLARALVGSGVTAGGEEGPVVAATMVEAVLRRSALGLAEAVRQSRLASTENVLVLVDQFEELFRFEQVTKSGDADVFVDLLLEASRAEGLPLYVVLTMRSDFLGECSRFRDLPAALNQSQYLIPRQTREQRREAIAGPVGVARTEIAPRLVQRMLNDVGDKADQLPILQHALMRTWQYWQEAKGSGNEPLDLMHYEAIGGMADALSRHADEVYAELPERGKLIAEKLFKCLTDKGPDNREVRRPSRVAEICSISGASEEEVIAVADAFRREGRSFLMPPARKRLDLQSVLDISHESLIRQWKRLRNWVEEEAGCGVHFSRLADAAELYRAGTAGLWRDPQLSNALQWREASRPNGAWASRYAPGYDAAMEFLDASLRQRDAEVARERQGREAKRRRAYALAALFAVIAIGMAVLASWALANGRTAREALKQAELSRVAAEDRKKLAEDQKALAEKSQRSAREAQVGAEESRLQEQGARAAALTKSPGREFDALALAIASTAGKRGKEMPPAAISSLEAAVTATQRSFPYRGHIADSISAVLSPDSSRLLTNTGAPEYVVRLWDTSNGRRLASFRQAKGGAWRNLAVANAFSPDGKRGIVPTEEGAKIFRTADGRVLRTIFPRAPEGRATQPVVCAIFSPVDNKLVFVAGQSMGFWNADTGELISSVASQGWTHAAFSRDGTHLLTGGQINQVRVWDVPGGKRLEGGFPARTAWAVYSPDSKFALLALDLSGTRIMRTSDWRSPDWKSIGGGNSMAPSEASFSPDGKHLILGSELIDLERGESLGELPGRFGQFSGDGRYIVTIEGDGATHLLDGTGGEVARLQSEPDNLLQATISRDGRYVVTTQVGTVRLWDTRDDRSRVTIGGKGGSIKSASLSPDGRRVLLVREEAPVAELWDTRTGKPLAILKGHTDKLSGATFSPDGRQVLTFSSYDHSVRLWDAFTGAQIRQFGDAKARAYSGIFLSGGKQVMTAGEAWVIWDTQTGSRMKRFEGLEPGRDLYPCMFSADGSRAATLGRDQVELRDAVTWKILARYPAERVVAPVCLSPGGTQILTASMLASQGMEPGVIEVRDSRTGKVTAQLKGHRAEIPAWHYAPSGDLILTGSFDRTAGLWEVKSGARLATLEGHTGFVRLAEFSPDGARVVTAGGDRTARVWDTKTGYQLATLRGHEANITSVMFSSDGKWVLTASEDGTAKIYDVDPAGLGERYFEAACTLLRYQSEFEQVRNSCDSPPPGR